jgi:hypothetical protein
LFIFISAKNLRAIGGLVKTKRKGGNAKNLGNIALEQSIILFFCLWSQKAGIRQICMGTEPR